MGSRGPVPKRASQRRRRNKPNEEPWHIGTQYACGCFRNRNDPCKRPEWLRACDEHWEAGRPPWS